MGNSIIRLKGIVSIFIILGIVGLSLWQARTTKARLEEVEKRSVKRG